MLSGFHRPRPVAWFFFLLAMGITLTAGTWQVERLAWKQGVIAALAEAQSHLPRQGLPTDEAELNALQFYPVTVKGRWLSAHEFHIAPRYVNDKFGYALVQPLLLADGRTLMVNRGWIPGSKKEPKDRPESAIKGNATITGLVRVGAERGYFTPDNQPEKNIWFGRDVAQMAEFAGLKNVVPAMVDVVVPEAVVAQAKQQARPSLPIPSDGRIKLRNDHLSYIITWYGIALGVLVIFVLAHRKKRPA